MKKGMMMAALLALGAVLLMAGNRRGTGEAVRFGQGDAQTIAKVEALVDDAFALLKENGGAAEAIWPGYTLEKNSVVVCLRDDETREVVRAWQLTTKEKRELTGEELAGVEIPAAGGYSAATVRGKKSIVISVSRDTMDTLAGVAIRNFIYEIGVHEMVHFYYESPFKLMRLANEQRQHGGRGTAFPKAAMPRAYRRMVYDNLVSAFDCPEDEALYLGRAKYWNERWKAEYPQEVFQAKITDYMEGRARYIQYMLCMPQGLGDQAAWMAARLDRSGVPAVSIDKESYLFGFVAGALLDRRGGDWKAQLNKNPEAPVELLLRDVESVADEDAAFNGKLRAAEQAMAEVNETTYAKLAGVEAAERDASVPFLQMKSKFLGGSFQTSDFVNFMDRHVNVDFGGTFESKRGTMQLSGVCVYEEGGAYVLPLTMAHAYEGGVLTIGEGGAVGSVAVTKKTDKDGRIVYTMR